MTTVQSPEKIYDRRFYDETQLTSMSSAQVIAPLVLDLVNIASVVDLGCGTGAWLAEFARMGVEDILGIDNASMANADLQIPLSKTTKLDLTDAIQVNRRFDLAMCLEVAEHLPESSAKKIVQALVGLSPIVLFSAAIPHQGGTSHINEQWPEYWAEMFAEFGYAPVDCIRESVWHDDRVAYWYAQNLLLYVRQDLLKSNDKLQKLAKNTDSKRLTRIHPKTYVKNHQISNDAKSLLMRLVWNILPRPIRVFLIKPLAPLLWKQVNTKY